MIILQVDFVGISVLKSKGQAPISRYLYAPKSFLVSRQRMQSITGQGHIFNLADGVQSIRDTPNSSNLLLVQQTTVVVTKELFQAFVLESFNHLCAFRVLDWLWPLEPILKIRSLESSVPDFAPASSALRAADKPRFRVRSEIDN